MKKLLNQLLPNILHFNLVYDVSRSRWRIMYTYGRIRLFPQYLLALDESGGLAPKEFIVKGNAVDFVKYQIKNIEGLKRYNTYLRNKCWEDFMDSLFPKKEKNTTEQIKITYDYV